MNEDITENIEKQEEEQDLRTRLVDSGAGIGHSFLHPRMKDYAEKGPKSVGTKGVYVINLDITEERVRKVADILCKVAKKNKAHAVEQVQKGEDFYKRERKDSSMFNKILFVGTSQSAQDAIEKHAKAAGCLYVHLRWPPGLLTNFETTRKTLKKVAHYESRVKSCVTKREKSKMENENKHIERTYSGVKNMYEMPDYLVVVNPQKEKIAVKEAAKLGIPVAAIVDTDTDPTGIEQVIPANDDAIKSVETILAYLSKALIASMGLNAVS